VVLRGSSASRRYKGIHDNIGKQELRFVSRHKPLEGVFLPESSPKVLRDPPFIQCLVTIHFGVAFSFTRQRAEESSDFNKVHCSVPFRDRPYEIVIICK